MKKSGKIIIISGPSGSGKTTIVMELLKHYKELSFSVSATTRAQRANETDKKDYYFLTPDEFKKKIDLNEFLEYEEVYPGIIYGTLNLEIERIFSENKIPVLDIDVKGAIHIKKIFPEIALTVFINPGSLETLEKRLTGRKSENPGDLKTRLDKAKSEIALAGEFDKTVINDSELKKALNQVIKILDDFLTKH